MTRRLALALFVAAPSAMAVTMSACAAEKPAQGNQAAAAFDTGKLTIAGEAFTTAEILDARALPDVNGKVGVMLTLTPTAAKRLEGITGSLVGKPMLVALDGKTLAAELIRKPLAGGVIEIPGRWNLADGEALARRISGRDPLPDDLGGE
jgi:preprotein translocase subunit SecD